MKKALIVFGGWKGHEPDQVAAIFRGVLEAEGFDVAVSDTFESLTDADELRKLHLIVPVQTMGPVDKKWATQLGWIPEGWSCDAVIEAVADGTGIAGCHGAMSDAFRQDILWQFMCGANWVAHPGGMVEYTVNVKPGPSLLEGLGDFTITSEQYYLHVDPAVEVLATTRFPNVTWYHASNGPVDMPQVYTKRWGAGRVFNSTLGHVAADFAKVPEILEIMRRGFLWAADGKEIAIREGLDSSPYKSPGQGPEVHCP